MKVAVGGTFEPLHEGHKRLIDVAIKIGGRDVMFGVTSDEMARKRFRSVLPFEIRVENLRRYIIKRYGFNPNIVKIDDCYGKTLEIDFEYIVVSPETHPNAVKINEKRAEIGKRPIKIVRIDFILASDKKPISSTRIKNGEIDRYGNVL